MYDEVISTAGMQGEVDTGQSMCREKTDLDLAEEEEEVGEGLGYQGCERLDGRARDGNAVAVWNSDRFLQSTPRAPLIAKMAMRHR